MLKEARELIIARQARAQAEIFQTFEDILAGRIEYAEAHNGNGDAAWGWSMQHKGETPDPIFAAGVVLNSVVRRNEMLTCYCADCHILYLLDEASLTCEASKDYLKGLSPEKKKVLLNVAHSINGLNPPVTILTLIDNGIESSGGLCPFCNRVNGTAEYIRKDQRKKGKPDCFGTRFDRCDRMEECSYLWSERVFCVIPEDRLALGDDVFENCPLDFWTWYLRVASLKKKGLYRFELPQINN